MSPLVESQSILSCILSQYGVTCPEDAIEDSLERLKAVVGILPLISLLLAGSCPIELSIPVSFEGNTVGNVEVCDLGIVEELKVEERNLFAIFPIGATMQDGGKRKKGCCYDVLIRGSILLFIYLHRGFKRVCLLFVLHL